jgi:hypothetical protein
VTEPSSSGCSRTARAGARAATVEDRREWKQLVGALKHSREDFGPRKRISTSSPSARSTAARSSASSGRPTVISLARLDPENYGDRADPSLLRQRFRKLLTRSVGYLDFRFPDAAGSSSPLGPSIRSLADVDAISPTVPRWGSAS